MARLVESEAAMAFAVANLLGSANALNYFTYLHEDAGFIYFSAPAVANIRTSGSLNMAVAELSGAEYELTGLNQLFNRQKSVVGNPNRVGYDVFDRMLDDPDVLKFTFIRDPVSRFAAVYQNTFSINTRQSEHRKTLFGFLGMPIEENLSMLDLAELLVEESELKALLPQLRGQRQMTGFDLVEYSFIGRHENWSRDFAKVSYDIFGRDIAQFDPVKQFNKDPEGVELLCLVDDETKAALREAYREDYEMIEEVAELFPDGFSAHHV